MAKPWAKPFYRSKQWRGVREYIIKRDNYLCQFCGLPAKEVHYVTHLNPTNIYDPTVPSDIASGNSTTLNLTINVRTTQKLDSFCNKYFWQRTA